MSVYLLKFNYLFIGNNAYNKQPVAHQDIINYFDKDNVQLCIIGYCTALDVNDNNIMYNYMGEKGGQGFGNGKETGDTLTQQI